MSELKIVATNDGSASVFSEKFNQQYHSLHGAIQESMHVFINAGLHFKIKSLNEISILEIGFGTGLNALLTLNEAIKSNTKINFTTIEKYPLDNDIIERLNYGFIISMDNSSALLNQMHACEWNSLTLISNEFYLKKVKLDFENIDFINEFDIIYFDAFAPNAQPELWTISMFEKMYNALKTNGILVTYCAKGEVKRNLKVAGFQIESLPGPVGKREMTRAIKK
ncbi:MAG TPA: tRNA (5-methylaminomethyl-2-thiouridine)(34)-methyltransferase MnmD [Chitinophagales bacterium]|nr:tRNA (5-methylaminomethyl-2-thiouridine)(34)-methyltransferase MnmD [Chitinophagales bacterium]